MHTIGRQRREEEEQREEECTVEPPWDLNGSSDVVDVSVAWDMGVSKHREGLAGVARKCTREEKQIGNKATRSTIKRGL